jgi:hypothetical protein
MSFTNSAGILLSKSPVRGALIDTLDLIQNKEPGTSRRYSPSKCLMAAKWNILADNPPVR